MLRDLFRRRPTDPADALIHWLGDKSIDDRRIAAGVLYGGPSSHKVYTWLLTREDCDVGTAAMLLWEFGLPYAVIRGSGLTSESELNRQIIDFIAARWRRGQFAAAVFAYDPRLQAKHYRRELAKAGLKGTDPLGIPDEAWQPIAGRPPAGTEATAYRTASGFDQLLAEIRRADLAARSA